MYKGTEYMIVKNVPQGNIWISTVRLRQIKIVMGRVELGTGSSLCMPCVPGTFMNIGSTQSCKTCVASKYGWRRIGGGYKDCRGTVWKWHVSSLCTGCVPGIYEWNRFYSILSVELQQIHGWRISRAVKIVLRDGLKVKLVTALYRMCTRHIYEWNRFYTK